MLSIPRTAWPVLWTRALRSHHDVSRHNAMVAMKVLAERRREREDVERYLDERYLDERHPARRTGS